MCLSINEREALSKLKETLSAQGLRPLELRLFGSKARGDYDAESDIDLAVVLESVDRTAEQRVFHACFEVGLVYDVLISPMVLSRDEINSPKHRITPFFKTLEREGVPV